MPYFSIKLCFSGVVPLSDSTDYSCICPIMQCKWQLCLNYTLHFKQFPHISKSSAVYAYWELPHLFVFIHEISRISLKAQCDLCKLHLSQFHKILSFLKGYLLHWKIIILINNNEYMFTTQFILRNTIYKMQFLKINVYRLY